VSEGRKGDALDAFMRVTGSPDAENRRPPRLALLAEHGVPSPTRCPTTPPAWATARPPADRLARITQATLVATGDAGHLPDAPPWVRALGPAADAIAAAIPRAERRTLAGQSHVADPEVVAPTLHPFLSG
jgi:hypothetical protein